MSTAQNNSSLIIIAVVVVLASAGFVVMQAQHQGELEAVMPLIEARVHAALDIRVLRAPPGRADVQPRQPDMLRPTAGTPPP